MKNEYNFDTDIDFDEASKEWRKNKKYISNGMFVYTCNYIHSNGKKCNKQIYSSKINNNTNTIDVYKYNLLKYNSNTDAYCKKHLIYGKIEN